MYNVGFIPVRAGSSLHNKNILSINKKPLIYWSLLACENSVLNKVFVSTDSIEIRNVIESFQFKKVEIINRSKNSSSDTATSEIALLEFCNNYEFDNVVFLQATSPLTTYMDINGALDKYLQSDKKSLISVVNRHQFIWNTDGTPNNYNPQQRPRRQDWDGYYIENGAFYISSKEEILKTGCRITPPVDFWEMSDKTLFEIDKIEDFELIEKMF